MLCQSGLVNVSSTNGMQHTALHIAALNDLYAVAKVLVCSGIDVLLKNADDCDALDLASNMEHETLTLWLAAVVEAEKLWREIRAFSMLMKHRKRVLATGKKNCRVGNLTSGIFREVYRFF